MSDIDSGESASFQDIPSTRVEVAVCNSLKVYTGLTGMRAPLAEMALRLARAYDGYAGDDLTKLSRLNQELRQTLQVIAEVGLDDDDDRTGGLPAPVRHPADGSADVGPGGGGGSAPAG